MKLKDLRFGQEFINKDSNRRCIVIAVQDFSNSVGKVYVLFENCNLSKIRGDVFLSEFTYNNRENLKAKNILFDECNFGVDDETLLKQAQKENAVAAKTVDGDYIAIKRDKIPGFNQEDVKRLYYLQEGKKLEYWSKHQLGEAGDN